jgi:hypothetical protein
MEPIKINNCTIKEYVNVLTGLSGVHRKIYTVIHDLSHETISSISLAESIRISRLLDLDYCVGKFYYDDEQEFINSYEEE